MEETLAFPGIGDDVGWKCQKHPSAQPTAGGVCPVCLRERLLRLCPHCGGGRPCPCSCPSTCSTTSSSSSSLSSADIIRCGATGAQIGAVGRVSHLIGCEPAFRRSRSAAFRVMRPRPDDASDGCPTQPQASGGRGGRFWLWPFHRGKKTDEKYANDAAATATATLSKSRSVGALMAARAKSGAVDNGARSGEGKPRGWNWYFSKALKHQKTSKATQAKYPFTE